MKELRKLIDDCPFGFAYGRVLRHRSSTDAECIEWLQRLFDLQVPAHDCADTEAELARLKQCTWCKSSGRFADEECPGCDGSGLYRATPAEMFHHRATEALAMVSVEQQSWPEPERCPYHSRAWNCRCDLPAGHDGEWCVSAGDCFAPGFNPWATEAP